MIDRGIFHPGERLELVGGELVVREPQGGAHALGIELVADALEQAFGATARVRVQLPIALDDESEPEPDVSVVGGPLEDADPVLPSGALLIVEVSDSSLALDRTEKASLYAGRESPTTGSSTSRSACSRFTGSRRSKKRPPTAGATA